MSAKLLSLFTLVVVFLMSDLPPDRISSAEAHQIQDLTMFDLSSSSAMPSMLGDQYDGSSSEMGEFEDESMTDGRRSLYWKRKVYYISYGALSANRVPCPPRSGRSYYTHNCFGAHGPANPYYRGCSCISRCRR